MKCQSCGVADCRWRLRTGRRLTVALAGQPNVGKSTIFNLLTGSSEHVGNWPGKTVEQKLGTCRCGDVEMRVVDLPGTYSMSANSTEERIARDYILHERPDVVVAIVDATALERGLYLVAELLALHAPVVVGLNMVDVAEQQGVQVEAHVLEASLGLPVVPMAAARNRGLGELLQAIRRVTDDPEGYAPRRPVIRADHADVLQELEDLVAKGVPEPYSASWVALKLLEGDAEITAMVRRQLEPSRWAEVHAILMRHEDAILAVAGGRYEWIGRMVRAAVVKPRFGQFTLTDRLDRFATHPLWGMLILIAVLGVAFWMTYSVAAPLQQALESLVQIGARWIRAALAPSPGWVVELLAAGVLGGAGTVLTFVPIVAVFFAVLAVLEDVGYMARAAYVMDRYMHLVGLHGRSFLPLSLAFGCNVPAVLGARIVDSPRARNLTILLAPFVPCTARMAVVAVLAPVFFGRYAPLAALILAALVAAVLAGVGVALHKVILGGERVAFIMELPLYHAPSARTIGLSVWRKTAQFVRKAGSVIVVVSVAVWALSTFPGGSIESSYLAGAARQLEPVGALMGLDWRMMVALLGGFLAKENAIAILGVLYSGGSDGPGLSASLAGTLTPAAALAFLAVQLLFIPCAATLASIQQETRSWRWPAASVALMLAISLGVGIAIFQLATLARLGL